MIIGSIPFIRHCPLSNNLCPLSHSVFYLASNLHLFFDDTNSLNVY